ncbi:MAG TPA: hypothetical protein VK843_22305, partial [Planctomycetota bacterium]|nr:hypothetical protein [Planctomycetota bacterium]
MHRILRLLLFAASSLGALASAFATGALERGLAPLGASASEDWSIPAGAPLIVSKSGKVKPAEYMRSPLGPEAKGGVIVLEKLENVTLDLRGVVLRGATLQTPLDKLAGFGLVVR